MPKPLNIIVLLSGHGSTLQAIMDAIANDQCDAKIVAVISDKPEAYGLQRAIAAGLKTHVLSKQDQPDRIQYDIALVNLIDSYRPDLIILAGFMRVLSPSFVLQFPDRLINIHPSLLPSYKGLNTHQRVLDAGETQHGTTVHFVVPELDAGPIIVQKLVKVEPDDTAETLKHRVQAVEHALYPEVIQWFAEDRIKLTGEGVVIDGQIV